tara:strand:- start:429 stop:1130 length:702 start_codon:yes stop_codon:yes gene_type:complete
MDKQNKNKIIADRIFMILSAVFIASLVGCNLIFQKFFEIQIWLPLIGYYTFQQSVGLLAYPITFLVTDIISEIYGKRKANQVVVSGLAASLFMLFIVTISDMVPMAPWSPVDSTTFHKVFGLSGAAVFASMMAYLCAQFIDIRLFHFWKKLTNGKHLWLRNNASTIFSQFIDTFSVLFLLCSFGVIGWERFSILLINGFFFKVFFAAFDTPFFYLAVYFFHKKFNLEFGQELK